MKNNPELIRHSDYQKTCFRYRFCKKYIKDKDVLEIGSGYKGIGLSYLSRDAKSLTGTDYNKEAIESTMGGLSEEGLSIVYLDANKDLPFSDDLFDVVIALEIIYYLNDLSEFISECSRILKPEGVLIISQHNKEYSNQRGLRGHHEAKEIINILNRNKFTSKIYGAFTSFYEKLITVSETILGVLKKITSVDLLIRNKVSLNEVLVKKYCWMIESKIIKTKKAIQNYRYIYIVSKKSL
jgi:2-polyprenyl-3-methyl-5-hydroxy-6-metoxy-1,4-benzoquinol methylase